MQLQVHDLLVITEFIIEADNLHGDKGPLSFKFSDKPPVRRDRINIHNRLHKVRLAHLLKSRLILKILSEHALITNKRILNTESVLFICLPDKVIITHRNPGSPVIRVVNLFVGGSMDDRNPVTCIEPSLILAKRVAPGECSDISVYKHGVRVGRIFRWQLRSLVASGRHRKDCKQHRCIYCSISHKQIAR